MSVTEAFGRVRGLRRERGRDGLVRRRHPERPRSMDEALAAAAARAPDGDALVFDDRRWTWLALKEEASRLAGGLAELGVGRGDRVALYMENDPSFVLLAFAAWRLGAAIVPIGAREQRPGVLHAVSDSGASLLLFGSSIRQAVPFADDGVRAICVEDDGFEALARSGKAAAIPVHEEELAAILYTSGTTGPPKGVTLSHGAIVHSALSLVAAMELGAEDRSLAAVPLSHVTGLVALIATMAAAGGALVVQRSFSAKRFLETAERERVTHTVMVPAMYNLLLIDPELARRDLSAWRVAGFGGAPMPVPTVGRLRAVAPGLRLVSLYGATETASPAVIMPPDMLDARPDAVGVAAPGCNLAAMDADGREVSSGETGELWIRGPMVTRGYWRREIDAKDFVDGWWRSGDLGSIDEEGVVTLRGRSKETINRGGFKIYPAEVESALAAVPGVLEAAIVARPCGMLGQRVHAVVVMREGESLDGAESMRSAIAAAFTDYKVPETWDLRREPLPRNANGKVQKAVLERDLEPYQHRR